jgi:KilA-N domain
MTMVLVLYQNRVDMVVLFAHKDTAFEFDSWISIESKLYIIKAFQRFKEDENNHLQLNWNLQRTLAKIIEYIPMPLKKI